MIMAPILQNAQTKYRRGEVVLAYFPDSNGTTSKARPVLIVQANDLQTGIEQIVVATITSNIRRAGHPSRIMILLASLEGINSGLARDSVLMTDSIATIARSEIDYAIGFLPMPPVEAALRHTFGF